MRSPRRKAPSVPASLQRSASASNRRFSLPENWRRLAIATTSGSRRPAASEAVSPVALRAPSATASEEEPNDPFIEDFSNELMCMSYLYSKLPETGVSPHIGTGGTRLPNDRRAKCSITLQTAQPTDRLICCAQALNQLALLRAGRVRQYLRK